MSPVEQLAQVAATLSLKDHALKVQPKKRNFSLDALYKSSKVQPHIGTEFEKGIQIRDLLNAPNTDELILDFAVLVSERNVVFLRDQDISFEEQKEFADRLGRASGKPNTSGLHTHPTSEGSETNLAIVSENTKRRVQLNPESSEFHSIAWHADITFEPVPSDYAVLKLKQIPSEGGDTLWASAYEVYERLTATHDGRQFARLAAAGLSKINPGPRGAPEDVGTELEAVHPVIRTNPVTGWKGVFVSEGFTRRINELSKDESDIVLQHLFKLVFQNHDLQVRFRWNTNDVAVWDNRSSLHTATFDFDADVPRVGERATSLGERPYLDVNSTSRREALGIAPPLARRAHLAGLNASKNAMISSRTPSASLPLSNMPASWCACSCDNTKFASAFASDCASACMQLAFSAALANTSTPCTFSSAVSYENYTFYALGGFLVAVAISFTGALVARKLTK
ncbi:hypothetical protein HDU98_008575 [Podochytrium sp. JEL0797]|nr:hypothetical protein HDU98_008575 [Podochytrium sp. JEL0797]